MKPNCTFIAVCSNVAWITYTHVWSNSICTMTMCARVLITIIYIFKVMFAAVDCKLHKWMKLVCTFNTVCTTIAWVTNTCVWVNSISADSMSARVWLAVIYTFNVSIAAVYISHISKQRLSVPSAHFIPV